MLLKLRLQNLFNVGLDLKPASTFAGAREGEGG